MASGPSQGAAVRVRGFGQCVGVFAFRLRSQREDRETPPPGSLLARPALCAFLLCFSSSDHVVWVRRRSAASFECWENIQSSAARNALAFRPLTPPTASTGCWLPDAGWLAWRSHHLPCLLDVLFINHAFIIHNSNLLARPPRSSFSKRRNIEGTGGRSRAWVMCEHGLEACKGF